MSHSSIFSSALNRALLRRPLSLPALRRLNSTLCIYSPAPLAPDARKRQRELRRRWIPRRRQGIARAVFGVTNNPGRENRPMPRDLLGLLHGLDVATDVRPFVQGKTDLGHFDPLAPTWVRKQQWRRKFTDRHWAGLSLKGIAESFIYHFYYMTQKALPRGPLPNLQQLGTDRVRAVFGTEQLAYLEARGYKPEDVMAWTWILMAENGVLAVLRLDSWAKVEVIKMEQEAQEQRQRTREEKLAQDWRKRVEEWKKPEGEESGLWGWNTAMGFFRPKRQDPEAETANQQEPIVCPTSLTTASDPDTPSTALTLHIPPFLLLFILRLRHLPATTLRVLFPYITTILEPTPFSYGDTKTPLVLLIRLLRHTRAVYPNALPHVVTLITTHIHPTSSPPASSPRLTATYNRLLSLFSLPAHNRPFKSLPHQQRSQFLLLRKMASLDIPVTREGYRALASVQLAHRKTAPETALSRSLASTWPPWPTIRDGHAGSASAAVPALSRAAQVLRQMTEAGYAWLGWETEAAVLAGTDTDTSPTIQTRTFYHARRGGTAAEDPCALWAVRVRATRTVEEAWCVFLAATEARALTPDVWEEMFAKVVAAAKGRALRDAHRKRLESIQAAWKSADEGARLRVGRALQRWDLAQKLLLEREKRIFPGDGKEVAVAPVSPSDGIHVDLPVPGVEELFAMMRRVGGGGGRVEIGPRLVAMLVRAAESLEGGKWVIKEWSKEKWRRLVKGAAPPESLETVLADFRPFKKRHHHANPQVLTAYLHLLLTHSNPPADHTALATRLLLGHAPPYTPAWNTVMSGLATTLSDHRLPPHTKRARTILIWRLYTAMTKLTGANPETIRILCVTAQHTLQLTAASPTNPILWGSYNPTDQVHRIFAYTHHAAPPLPPLLLPEPATLHAYMRLLGFAARHADIVALLKWMADELAPVEMAAPMARRVLVAACIFLARDPQAESEAREVVGAWLGTAAAGADGERGGWPGTEEAEEYCILGGMW